MGWVSDAKNQALAGDHAAGGANECGRYGETAEEMKKGVEEREEKDGACGRRLFQRRKPANGGISGAGGDNSGRRMQEEAGEERGTTGCRSGF